MKNVDQSKENQGNWLYGFENKIECIVDPHLFPVYFSILPFQPSWQNKFLAAMLFRAAISNDKYICRLRAKAI